jgi:uncharacterized protein (DUF697 family)
MELIAERCPELWLLGKAGAGKSALVRLVDPQAPAPGARTRALSRHGGPGPSPEFVLVDTPGLGSAGSPQPHPVTIHRAEMDALVIVHRLDDMVSAPLNDVVRAVMKARPKLPLLLVLTGADLAGADEGRARAYLSGEISAAAGRRLDPLVLTLPPDTPPDAARAALVSGLSRLTAEIGRTRATQRLSKEERAQFERLRPLVLRHATAAGLSDAAPLVGAITVPAVQARLLSALARDNGLTWTPRRAALFASALGAGAIANFGAGYALRQGAKMVPLIGPVLGGAASMSMGFAATYALGRAAAAWLFHHARGHDPDANDLRLLYRRSYDDGPDAA